MTARRWMLFGSLAALAGISSIGCGDSSGDDDGDGGTSGTTAAGSAGVGPAGSAGTSGGAAGAGTSGSSAGGSSGASPTGGAGAGTAGTPPMGGTAGAGGAVGGAGGVTGGSAGAGAAGGAGGSSGVTCEHTIASSTISEKIKTVGIVEWSTNLAGVTSARIEFGLDTTYGLTAPVTTVGATNRTLLLGMKQDSTYHYRIVATSPEGDCVGSDQTIVTDFLPSGLPTFEIETLDAAKVYGGYLLMGNYTQTPAGGAAAYIIDPDGDIVWAYLVPMRDVSGVRMSWDGQHMWLNSANVPESQGANVHRITMDGLMDEDLSEEFEGANHQLTVLPDETVGFYAYAAGGSDCDDVKEYDPSTGMTKLVVNSGDAHGASGPCHLNAIEYSPPATEGGEGAYLFSDLQNDNITKITRGGDKVWVIGGETNEFDGEGTTWDNQHGIDVLGENKFLFFNNGPNAANSMAIEMTLDLDAMTGERTWTYQSDRTINNIIMGDVQRLENGNTLVGYSTKGVLHEVDAEMNLVQEIVWGSSGYFGYIQMRKSLYGPPPR